MARKFDAPGAPDTFAAYHPALRPMRRVVEGFLERNHPGAFPLLGALAILNGSPQFWQGRAMADDEAAGGGA
jgi:hypothetical protein